jgi:ABC-2 type transport system ATP-binding protein
VDNFLQKAKAKVCYLCKPCLYGEERKKDRHALPPNFFTSGMSVNVSGLTKLYGQQKAVDNLSFSAQAGEIIGFLGPNGAGKSTTLKIMTGYLAPSSGEAEVCGFSTRTHSLEVRKHLGYLPEHNPLYLEMYVKEYLSFIGGLHQLRGRQLKERIQQVIANVGLQAEQHKRIGALSKGYRQRVGLASALIHQPPVLILDEPTTGLDPNQLLEIRQLIKDLGKDKTLIFSSHLMQEVEAVCNRVIIIHQGRLITDSPITQLQQLRKGKQVVLAEFANEAQQQLLEELPGVLEVEKTGPGLYRIVSNTDIRGEVFQLASSRQWALVGLKQQENTLEGLFQELTRL